MKIATLTYQRHDNYGAMLQCYALQKKIEQLGYECDVIDYICEVSENPFGLRALRTKGIKRYITGSIGAITRMPRAKKFNEFRKILKMSKVVTEKNISQLGAAYDGYIVGSDNVWNADITGLDERYFLSFVFDKRKRASYAASFGSSKINPEHKEMYEKLLNSFSKFAVREHTGAKLINDLTGREADVVCDPSILLTKEEWSALCVEPKEKYPYLLAYQMVPSGSFVKFVKEIAQKKGLKVIYIPFPYGSINCKIKPSIGPLEWLGLFKNAEYIVTDSFHGCAFSILFEKEFCVKISQLGERIENILSIMNIKNRVVNNATEVSKLNPIDYSEVREKLGVFREESTQVLKNILSSFCKLRNNAIADSSKCTGCFLCKKMCPCDAIEIKKDNLGFLYPYINYKKCTNCGKCESICEALPNQKESNSKETQRYYSAINKDFEIVKSSGSGGMFYEFAKSVIDSNGVVYGAAYGENFKIEHQRAYTHTELKNVMGTKYVQSFIYEIYDDLLDDLKRDRNVLFVGTPCQCAAVKEFLKNKNAVLKKFYCCDIFCHGVASPDMWSRYIDFLEEKFGEKIKFISFRDKVKGWRNKHLKILTENSDISDYCNDCASVLRMYEQNIALRESCYQCEYMDFERCGDISIGDFWGIERVAPFLDNNTGVSAVIVNTEKGKVLFDIIADKMNISEFDKNSITQQVLREPTKKNSKRNEFIDVYRQKGIEEVLTKYCQVKGKLKFKRDVLIPLLYRLHLAGTASKILHKNDG